MNPENINYRLQIFVTFPSQESYDWIISFARNTQKTLEDKGLIFPKFVREIYDSQSHSISFGFVVDPEKIQETEEQIKNVRHGFIEGRPNEFCVAHFVLGEMLEQKIPGQKEIE